MGDCDLGSEKGPEVGNIDPVCVQEYVRLALDEIPREYLEKYNGEYKISPYQSSEEGKPIPIREKAG